MSGYFFYCEEPRIVSYFFFDCEEPQIVRFFFLNCEDVFFLNCEESQIVRYEIARGPIIEVKETLYRGKRYLVWRRKRPIMELFVTQLQGSHSTHRSLNTV